MKTVLLALLFAVLIVLVRYAAVMDLVRVNLLGNYGRQLT
jgi:hypothetical protein